MKVVWTLRASDTYLQIIEFLSVNWTKNEVLNFVAKTEKVVKQINETPFMFVEFDDKIEIRKGFIN